MPFQTLYDATATARTVCVQAMTAADLCLPSLRVRTEAPSGLSAAIADHQALARHIRLSCRCPHEAPTIAQDILGRLLTDCADHLTTRRGIAGYAGFLFALETARIAQCCDAPAAGHCLDAVRERIAPLLADGASPEDIGDYAFFTFARITSTANALSDPA